MLSLKKKLFAKRLFYKKYILLKALKRWENKKVKNFILFSQTILTEYLTRKKWYFLKKRKKKLLKLKRIFMRRYTLPRKYSYLYLKVKDIYYWAFYSTKRQSFLYVKEKKLNIINDSFIYYKRMKDRFFRYRFKWKNKIFKKLKRKLLKKRKIFFIKFFFSKLIKKIVNLNVNKFKLFELINNILLINSNNLNYINYHNKFKLYRLLKSNLNLYFFFKKRSNYKKRRLKRKSNSYFKKKNKFFCNLNLRTTNSNFFITLTDLNNNVLISQSTGRICYSRMKKKKMSPYLVHNMMRMVKKVILKFNIKRVIVKIHSRINKHMHNVINSLKGLSYCRINSLIFSKAIPHHYGQRKQKSRRL